jgi:potassium efflux system protein
VKLLQRIARTLGVLLVLGLASGFGAALQCAYAQTAGPTQPSAQPPAAANTAPSSQAAPADLHIDKSQIAQRLNRELDFNLETTTGGWQQALDRVDGELARPRLRYTELNRLRDELQRVRSEVTQAWSKIQPRLDADRDQIKLLPPAPAAGAPPEPEQAARNRAELNYHLGLLSAAEATVNSTNLRIDNLLDKIQDIRRKNFTSALFQPIPGLYAYETWANVPRYVPDAARRVRGLLAEWLADAQNRGDLARVALEALLMLIILSVASWRGIRRLRRWRDDEEPPYWRRASSAAGVILLRALPVTAPAVFLCVMIASAQALPERVDWLFYLITQSIVIVFTVGALVTTAFAPRAPQWRLIDVPDVRAARICWLVLLLAFVYSLTSLLYGVTRLVQAPFALTIAVALPSSLLLAGIVVALLRTTGENGADAAPSARLFRAIRAIVWAIVAAIVVCALTGYLPLARFLAQQLIVTGSAA